MSVQTVEVELIENPQVKRTMTVNSFKQNQSRWRLVTPNPALTEKKPVAVVPVVGPVSTAPAETTEETDFASIEDGVTEAPAPEPETKSKTKAKKK